MVIDKSFFFLQLTGDHSLKGRAAPQLQVGPGLHTQGGSFSNTVFPIA